MGTLVNALCPTEYTEGVNSDTRVCPYQEGTAKYAAWQNGQASKPNANTIQVVDVRPTSCLKSL
jgi:hypothetical protein